MLNKEFLTELYDLFKEGHIEEYWNPRNNYKIVGNLMPVHFLFEDSGLFNGKIAKFTQRTYSEEGAASINKALNDLHNKWKKVAINEELLYKSVEILIENEDFIHFRASAKVLFETIMIYEALENSNLLFYKDDYK